MKPPVRDHPDLGTQGAHLLKVVDSARGSTYSNLATCLMRLLIVTREEISDELGVREKFKFSVALEGSTVLLALNFTLPHFKNSEKCSKLPLVLGVGASRK